MARRRNPLGVWLLTSLCLGFAWLTRVLPLSWARALGALLAAVAYHVLPRIQRVGMANLDLAYGDSLSAAEKIRILKESVRNVGLVAAEFTRTPLLGDDAFFTRWVRIEGAEHLARDRSAILIGPHIGNWEWLAGAFARLGRPAAEIVRPLHDPRLNRFIDRIRSSNAVKTIEKSGAGPEVLRLLREGHCVGLLIDQSPHQSAVPVRFFGVETWGTAAPAILSARAKAPVHVAALIREPDGRYVLRISPRVVLSAEGGQRARMLDNAQRCQDAIEALIRAYPEQWLWIHRRWKPRPRFEREWTQKQAQRDARTGGDV
ncbi:MAG TPA: lysophospholipid acyltransferase family protein [Candidatus Hydrogenedentes bacterium]|nr:lysophospholipid acyltransferase family protein [Candidatus Hydrogenedentota bacterium]